MNSVDETVLVKKIMTRLYTRERRRKFTMADAKATLKRFGYKSVWNGDNRFLTIVRIDRNRPMSPTNAMVIEVPEAYRPIPEPVLLKARTIAATAKPAEQPVPEAPCPHCHRTL